MRPKLAQGAALLALTAPALTAPALTAPALTVLSLPSPAHAQTASRMTFSEHMVCNSEETARLLAKSLAARGIAYRTALPPAPPTIIRPIGTYFDHQELATFCDARILYHGDDGNDRTTEVMFDLITIQGRLIAHNFTFDPR